MTVWIKLNESNASLRVVALPSLVSASVSTSAATNESGRTFYFSIGGVDYGSGGSLSAVSAAMGLYTCNFAASKVSVTGPGFVYYGLPNSSLTALMVSAPFMVVPVDSYDSMRMGLFALPNAAAAAANGLPTFGTGTGQINLSGGSTGIVPGVLSGVSVEVKTGGIQTASVGAGSYSGVSVEVKSGGIQTTSVGAGSYSGVSVEVKTGGIQVASVGKGAYSGVSVEVTTGGIQVASVGKGTYSGVTVETNNIAAGSYSGVTIQGLTNYGNFPLSSVATSIWSTARSNFTNPSSFGEYVYSQVTGTSTGTVQGVTRALNLSANDDKAGYSISGTKTTLDALNDINGSGVTLHVGTHSGATIQGLTRINSSVTIANGTYSAVSVQVDASGIVAGSLAAGAITSAKFGAGAIDAAALATDAGQEIADALLGRNIAGGSSTGRIVSEALYPLRNKVLIQSSVGTVYQTDDATSAWTFSPSLGTAPLSGIDPTT